MKILHISESDLDGGASRAAWRIHNALNESGHDSVMRVCRKLSDSNLVVGQVGPFQQIARDVSSKYAFLSTRLFGRHLKEMRSSGRSLLGVENYINKSDCDVVHLHWVSRGFLSIEGIARIKKPIVWTFHDMWPFCGGEHYAEDDANARWQIGYLKEHKSNGILNRDVDRRIWQRKLSAWRRPIHVIGPSQWMADCVSVSSLMKDWPTYHVPNALDLSVFKPLKQSVCREAFNLPLNKKLILFGALGGGARKGFDLLQEAILDHLGDTREFCFVVFGESEPKRSPLSGHDVRYVGRLSDDVSLAALYNTADIMVVPSRQEALGQTSTEAQACGVPVVAFDATGLRSTVSSRETGILCEPFDPKSLAMAISLLLRDDQLRVQMGKAARERALRLWSNPQIVTQHEKVYRAAIQSVNLEK